MLEEAILDSVEPIIAPHLIDLEATSALRRLVAAGLVDRHRAEQFLRSLPQIPVKRHEHTSLLLRIWELRHNFTCYDATYIALAEVTGSTLFTFNAKLLRGHCAKVKLFTNS